MSSVVTKTGDDGTTGLYGARRVRKDVPRLHAYGTVDELNALLGVILAEDMPAPVRAQLIEIQHQLFRVGADLATPLASVATVPRVHASHLRQLEEWIDQVEPTLPPLTSFTLPGGSRVGALLHQARTVCRRAERWVVTLSEKEETNPLVLQYINRLSDYFFVLSRQINIAEGYEDIPVTYR